MWLVVLVALLIPVGGRANALRSSVQLAEAATAGLKDGSIYKTKQSCPWLLCLHRKEPTLLIATALSRRSRCLSALQRGALDVVPHRWAWRTDGRGALTATPSLVERLKHSGTREAA